MCLKGTLSEVEINKERIILQVPAKSSLRVNRYVEPAARIASIERIELYNVLGRSQASLEAQNFR